MENNQRNIKDYDYNFNCSSEALNEYHAKRQKKISEKKTIKLIIAIINVAMIVPFVAKFLLLLFLFGGLAEDLNYIYMILLGGIIYIGVSVVCLIKFIWDFYH